jgi:hypothetical protein
MASIIWTQNTTLPETISADMRPDGTDIIRWHYSVCVAREHLTMWAVESRNKEYQKQEVN